MTSSFIATSNKISNEYKLAAFLNFDYYTEVLGNTLANRWQEVYSPNVYDKLPKDGFHDQL